jgi:hypothetical protein
VVGGMYRKEMVGLYEVKINRPEISPKEFEA